MYTTPPDALAEEYQLGVPPGDLRPRFNIAPSQLVPVIGQKSHSTANGLVMMRWGFVPRWAASPKEGPRPINARSETIRTSAPFRDSFRQRRCILPASGFYEWQTQDGKKVPYLFRPSSGAAVLSFAGIWDVWKDEHGEPLFTCAIITVPANKRLKPFHDRMPAILSREDYLAWLSPKTESNAAFSLLRTAPEDSLTSESVAPLMGA